MVSKIIHLCGLLWLRKAEVICSARRWVNKEVLISKFTALPMGFSHAVFLYQVLRRRMIENIPELKGHCFVQDKQVPDSIDSGVFTVHLDNFICLSPDPVWVNSFIQQVRLALNAKCFPRNFCTCQKFMWKFVENHKKWFLKPLVSVQKFLQYIKIFSISSKYHYRPETYFSLSQNRS